MAEGTRRIKCVQVDCTNLILPATAEANGGYCAPCVEKRWVEEQRKFVADNKRVVDPYVGITDLVELICAVHAPRKYDRLIEYAAPAEPIEQLYARLTSADADRLMDVAAEALKAGNEHFADTIATALATRTDFNLDRLLRAFVTQNKFWPSIIYRSAGPEIRDLIIAALNSSRAHANHGLSALAWIGDETVRKQFEAWDSTSPKWWEHLFVLPSEYAYDAGWEITPQGRRNLFHEECFGITAEDGANDHSVAIAEQATGECPWCNEKLIHLVKIDLQDSRFAFLGVKAKTLPVVSCRVCACYGTVFGEVTADGTAHWSDCNVRPKHLPADAATWSTIPWQGKAITLRKRRAIEAAYWCDSPAATQIGGMPSWIQDSDFPDCPCCKRTMMFLAQVDQSAFDGYEGIYYAFVCAQCRITATSYQQS
jgi:hypothetical protein